MDMKLLYLLSTTMCILLFPLFLYGEDNQIAWDNLCQASSISLCADVGKDAYNNDTNPIALRGLKLGKIVGVVWKEKGDVITSTGEDTSFSPQNGYYYIIEDDWGKKFLRSCGEIEARK